MNIIVVDDEVAALANFLYYAVNEEELNFQMYQLHPTKCLEYVSDHVVDAAFLDICMPEINGIDLADKLVKINPSLKIVFISGYLQDEKSAYDRLGGNLLGFCYKPYNQETIKRYLAEIKNHTLQERKIEIKTFGGFDVFCGGELVRFNSAKSKELFALLVHRQGGTVVMNDTLSCLWGDKNVEQSKRLYRDAVYRLRMVLKKYNMLDIVEFGRAQLILKTDGIVCDYWEFVNNGKGIFLGEYMQSYEWSIDTQLFLENKVLKHR